MKIGGFYPAYPRASCCYVLPSAIGNKPVCPECRCTCSVLPECIPPRSWYLWEVAGHLLAPSRRQLDRSHHRLQRQQSKPHDHQALVGALQPQLPELFPPPASSLTCMGRHTGFSGFWKACLALRPLSSAMRLLHEKRVSVHDRFPLYRKGRSIGGLFYTPHTLTTNIPQRYGL